MRGRSTTIRTMASCTLTLILLAALPAGATPHGVAQTLILFDHDALETPESIVFDRHDNAYLSLAMTGEVRKVSRDGTMHSLAFLPIGAPCGSLPTVALGLALDRFDRLYVAIAACDPANQGIWRVDRHTGEASLLVSVPPSVVPNGIDVHRGHIYIADTFGGKVWRGSVHGGPAEIWADDPLLVRDPDVNAPGPNGLRVRHGRVFVANSSTGAVVRIPIRFGGIAGQARLHATLPEGQGCDEFAFDVFGSIYCTTDPANTVVRLDPGGGSEVLLTAADGLDGPTSVAFGRRGANRRNLYITNAAFPIFTTTFRPSLMRIRLPTIGVPN